MSGHIPVTVLSGYLGSGKTTIINNVLAQPHGMRIAVLVNDFGPINIDAGLIASEDGETIELSNGCVCCSIGDELGEALSAVAAWDNPPDRVLLEASGVAEPARIAMTAGYWPGFSLDAVIVAADAETVRVRAADKFVGTLVRSQLDSADLIALTKTDLLPEDRVDGCRKWLSGSFSASGLLECRQGQLPAGILFGPDRPQPKGPPNMLILPQGHHQFATALWEPDGAVDVEVLCAALRALPESVHRAKGYVRDRQSGDTVLIQMVGRRCTAVPVSEAHHPGIVMIGTGTQAELPGFCTDLDACAG